MRLCRIAALLQEAHLRTCFVELFLDRFHASNRGGVLAFDLFRSSLNLVDFDSDHLRLQTQLVQGSWILDCGCGRRFKFGSW